MKLGQRRAPLVAAGLGLAAVAAAGAAFFVWGVPTSGDDTSVVAEQTSAGTPERWPTATVELQFDAGENPDVPAARLRDDFSAAIAAWQGALASCGVPSLSLGGTVSGHDVAFDQVNVVIWRLPGYCKEAAHAGDDLCLSPASTAVTTLFYVDKPGDAHDGDTLEADLELNGDHWRFADDGAADRIDLVNTAVHELGHLYGLDHTCVVTAATKKDVDGNVVPSCSPLAQLAPRITRATMFNFETPGETDRRAPRPNEAQKLCQLYQRRPASSAAAPAGASSSGGGATSTRGGGCQVGF